MNRPFRFGLVGHNISYTMSPEIFQALFARLGQAGSFEVVDASPDRLEAGLNIMRTWDGFSVTVPYKRKIAVYMDSLSPEAVEIGAVNSVRVDDGRLCGFNTDGEGFIGPLRQRPPMGGRFLILGNGGAAGAVLWALAREYPEAELDVCGREGIKAGQFVDYCLGSFGRDRVIRALTYADISDKDEYHLIVNATPAGGINYPDDSPLPDDFRFSGRPLCYDLNYRPAETLFMKRAEAAACPTIGGFPMLVRQAVASYMIWARCELDFEGISHDIMASSGGINKGGRK